MGLADNRLYYRRPNGQVDSVSLYTDGAEFQGPALCVRAPNGQQLYANTGATNDVKATPLYMQKGGTTYSVLRFTYPHGSQFFGGSGTFVVPAYVTTIYVTGSAGGGGGGGGGVELYSGGKEGAYYYADGNGGGRGGNSYFGGWVGLQGGAPGGGGTGRHANGGTGQSYGGAVGGYEGYGAPGGGGAGNNSGYNTSPGGSGGAGGRGATCNRVAIGVSPGQSIEVTVGGGGGGGAGGNCDGVVGKGGGGGAQGFILVQW